MASQIANAIGISAKEFDHVQYRPLYLAALKGDWKSAISFLNDNPEAAKASVSMLGKTVLHVAAIEGHSEFLEKLIEVIPIDVLDLQDKLGYTALHYAAIDGNIRSVKALVRKKPKLVQYVDVLEGYTPLLCAIVASKANTQKGMLNRKMLETKEVIWFLALVTRDEEPWFPFSGSQAGMLIWTLTFAGHYDISLYLLKRYPNLATALALNEATVLNALAVQPSSFHSGSKFGFCERYIYSFIPVKLDYTPPHSVIADVKTLIDVPIAETPISIVAELSWIKKMLWNAIECLVPRVKNIKNAKSQHHYAVELVTHLCKEVSQKNYYELIETYNLPIALNLATTHGISEIVKICLQFFPDLIWVAVDGNLTMLQVSIKQRQEEIFNLMSGFTGRNKMLGMMPPESWKISDSIMHIAAKLAPSAQLSSVSGSVFQLQRELQWFKEVEKLVLPLYREVKNEEGKTAWEVFKEEHKELVEKGEKWMKDTSNSCMLVSTLIATVVFAAAFTVPGGNTNAGIPVFLTTNSFMVFAISDALALFSSINSLLMFLSILTSRYAEEDFLVSLPKKLILGLAALFLATATMIIAFGAALSIVLGDRWRFVYVPITLLASFPVIMFVKLQLPLFINMVQSTYGPSIFRPRSIWELDEVSSSDDVIGNISTRSVTEPRQVRHKVRA